jgi:hypothetical protein
MRKIILGAVMLATLLIPVSALADKPPLPRVNTGPYNSYSYAKVRPAAITQIGDGASWFGGRTGHYSTGGHGRRRSFGHLRWRLYNYSEANATGVMWGEFGGESIQQAPFRIVATVGLHFYDVQDGTFRSASWWPTTTATSFRNA